MAQDGWIGQVPSAASVAVSAFTPGGKFSCTALELLKLGRIWPADMNGLVLSQYVRPPGQKILVKLDGLSSGRKHAGQPRASDGDLPGDESRVSEGVRHDCRALEVCEQVFGVGCVLGEDLNKLRHQPREHRFQDTRGIGLQRRIRLAELTGKGADGTSDASELALVLK